MSSLSTLYPSVRPTAVRFGVVTTFAFLLVVLGFFVPLWIVLIVAAALVAIVRAVRAVRAASSKIDRILAEELPPNGSVR
jgi:hypothetical protein